MADAIPGHLKLKDQNARYNQYKYGYRVNHGNSEISKIKKNWQHFFSTTLLKVYSFCNVNVTPFDVLALYNTKKSLEQQAPIFKVLWKLFVLC